MITPQFECSQTDETVITRIYCPAIRANDVEIQVDDFVFTAVINPYFLRLSFPAPVVEDDRSSAIYDPTSGYLTVTLSKCKKGLHFKDLDLLSKLLAPRPVTPQRFVEVVDPQDEEEKLVEKTLGLSIRDERGIYAEAAKNNWQLLQEVPIPLAELHLKAEKPYGFLDMHSGYFKNVSYADNQVNELGPDAENVAAPDRRKLRLDHEDEKWDEEHYMADYADDGYIQELLSWEHPHISASEQVIYTEEEKLAMLRLPRKEYLASPQQTHGIYLTLATMLFTYAYDTRTTQHDPTPESAWTISVLTPAFSALDPPPYDSASSLGETFVAVYRRCLAFPLYRSFALAEACRSDVAGFFSKGKRTVLRCLLELKHLLDHHEVYYVYSKIWVDDICVWLQGYTTDEDLFGWSVQIKQLQMEKSSVGWDLQSLEEVTRQTHVRESDSDDE